MKAVIVDDSKAVRILIGRIFKDLGYEILEAGNGQEALDVLASAGKVDIAVVDWNMPVMDGLEFVTAVRRLRVRDAMRILMVTTESAPEQVATAMRAGASEYLAKPFTRDSVRAKLDRIGLKAA